MAVTLKENYQRALYEQKKEVRELVMAGLEQIKEVRTKDFKIANFPKKTLAL